MTYEGKAATGEDVSLDDYARLGTVREIIDSFDDGDGRQVQAAEPGSLLNLPLTRLIGHIIDKHHVYARRQVTAIMQLLSELSVEHRRCCPPELVRVCAIFKPLREELLFHMEKEEISLFPRIIRTETASTLDEPQAAPCSGSLSGPIKVSMNEHDELCGAFDEIRVTMHDYILPDGACPGYVKLCGSLRNLELYLLQHVHLEDSLLFPRALKAEDSCAEAAPKLS